MKKSRIVTLGFARGDRNWSLNDKQLQSAADDGPLFSPASRRGRCCPPSPSVQSRRPGCTVTLPPQGASRSQHIELIGWDVRACDHGRASLGCGLMSVREAANRVTIDCWYQRQEGASATEGVGRWMWGPPHLQARERRLVERVALHGERACTRARVPHAQAAVGGARHHRLAVRGERAAVDGAAVAREHLPAPRRQQTEA
jgi:hypothetical protein